jgi:hypothetical protein
MIRMSDVNEGMSSLAKRFPKEIGNTMFRDNIMYVGPRGHNTCT